MEAEMEITIKRIEPRVGSFFTRAIVARAST